MNKNYFSASNIGKMADINMHIEYASSLLQRYKWECAAREKLETQLRAISDKQKDSKLNICVIGEFSTGKSSFINALVGDDLLAVNVLQGTTVAITIIEHGTRRAITVKDSQGKIKKEKFIFPFFFRKKLYRYTTDGAVARNIREITVAIPSESLKQNFRIIDTPGTNALELWHEEVTKRAINDIGDLSIVLMDASRPMPETLIQFVHSALGGDIKNCVFIANKIDSVRERERPRMIKYITQKVEQAFEMKDPVVLPFSPAALTNGFSKNKIKIDDNSFNLTVESVRQLMVLAAQHRIEAQARKLTQLIDGMYTQLQGFINTIRQQYYIELEQIERSRHTDLKPYIDNAVLTLKRDLFNLAQKVKIRLSDMVDTAVRQAPNKINAKIDGQETLDDLSKYAHSILSKDIKNEGKALAKAAEPYYAEIRNIFHYEVAVFQRGFEQEFRRLDILAVKFNIPISIEANSEQVAAVDVDQVQTLVDEELSNENWAMGGGAAAGAIIGSVICPGIGTVLGAIGGWFAGKIGAPDIFEVRSEFKSKLSNRMTSYFSSYKKKILDSFESYIASVQNNLHAEIEKYYTTYRAEVARQAQELVSQHAAIKREIQRTKAELDSIASRKGAIQNLLHKI